MSDLQFTSVCFSVMWGVIVLVIYLHKGKTNG